jgi:hypothetical protein
LTDTPSLCPTCGAAVGAEELPAIPVAELVEARLGRARPAPPAGVSRRFGLNHLLLIMLLFALLFGILSCLNAPPILLAMVAVFVAGVGVAQSLLFKGQAPRKASVLVGGPLCYSICLGVMFVYMWSLGYPGALHELFALAVLMAFPCVIFGAMLGYLAGCLIAAVFLGDRRETDDDEQDT